MPRAKTCQRLLAIGLALFGVVAAIVMGYLGRTAVVNDIADTGLEGGKRPLLSQAPVQEERATATLPQTFTNELGMEFILVPKGKSLLAVGAA